MLLFHEVCHSSKIYLLIDGLKLENGILKEVGSNESDAFACLSTKMPMQVLFQIKFPQNRCLVTSWEYRHSPYWST